MSLARGDNQCRIRDSEWEGHMTARKKAHKRELIEPHKGDKRFVRRDDSGRFHESDDVGRSLSQDRRRKSKTVAKKGQGDKGDRRTD